MLTESTYPLKEEPTSIRRLLQDWCGKCGNTTSGLEVCDGRQDKKKKDRYGRQKKTDFRSPDDHELQWMLATHSMTCSELATEERKTDELVQTIYRGTEMIKTVSIWACYYTASRHPEDEQRDLIDEPSV